ncbi:MAG: PepSY domain-containing protein [Oscillospiraceae bacterium]|nr:PepSY domain-containing protein [Oscillospiraceae bacterium]
MTDQELLNRLSDALDHAAPDDLDAVLSRCHAQKGTTMNRESMEMIPAPAPKRKRRYAPWLAAACLVLVLAGAFGLYSRQNTASVASIVSLDVNPSIEMKLNNEARVVSVTALNQDAVAILDGMDLKGADVNVAVNALVGSLLKHGYVDELANSILVTVEDSDSARGTALQQTLSQEINDILSAASVNAAVLSQTVSADSALQSKADQYGISLGKAVLIQSLVDQSTHLTFEELVGLTVNELNLLASNPTTTLTSVSSTGSASDGAYIGTEAAQAAAYAHAGVTASSVRELETEFDYEDGRMVYDVEFKSGTTEYEYDIDAVNGTVIKYKTDRDDDYRPATSGTTSSNTSGTTSGSTATTSKPSSGSTSKTPIGAASAKSIALKHAGVSESSVLGMQVKEDWDDGTLEYNVEFWYNSTEYEYEINAYTGTILKYEQDRDDDHHTSSSTSSTTASPSIDTNAAKSAAAKHAGVSVSDMWDVDVDYEKDAKTPYYEVDFKCGGMEYEYKISAVDGSVLSHHSERD